MGTPLSRNRRDETEIDKTPITDGITVSTIFLGVDSGRPTGGIGRYETKVFGGSMDGQSERHNTEAAAREGHHRWVEKVKAAIS